MPTGRNALLDLVSRDILSIAFDLGAEITAVRELAARYRGVPMSLADGCVVKMTERCTNSTVMTLDSNLSIYWRNGRQSIP